MSDQLKQFVLQYIRNTAHALTSLASYSDILPDNTFYKEGKPVNIGYMRRRRHNQRMYTIFIQLVKGAVALQYQTSLQSDMSDIMKDFDQTIVELGEEKLIDISADGNWISLTPRGGKLAKDISRFYKI